MADQVVIGVQIYTFSSLSQRATTPSASPGNA